MTREQYESLPLKQLREIAKSRNLKGTTAMRKEQLIERMLEEDAKDPARTESVMTQSPSTPYTKAGSLRSEYTRTDSTKPDAARNAYHRSESGSRRNFYKSSENEHGNRRDFRQNESRERPATYDRQSESHEHLSENERQSVDEHQEESFDESENEQLRQELGQLDSGAEAHGILEVMADGYGFIRSENFLPGDDDVYVSPSQIRKFRLKTGDVLCGNTRIKTQNEKFSALLFVKTVNGLDPYVNARRMNFEDMTPIFPNERIHLERPGGPVAMRIVDLVSPIGKGQRGMIVSPPKAGKTTLLKDAAKSILRTNPEMHVIILLIDERPEEVTDIKETVRGKNVEVIYSTFDELPEHHKRVSEMVIERAKRLVENKQDVIIFIDSITRLARAYNQVVPPSGRTLSGGLDPAALHMPKRFFGAARNMREGGSLTILATALVDTGSKMDDVVYEEFKGTGNMELILDRKLQERRVFPAIDLARSGTRREDLLLDSDELEAVNNMRRALNGLRAEEAGENVLNMFAHTRNNRELVQMLKKQRIV